MAEDESTSRTPVDIPQPPSPYPPLPDDSALDDLLASFPRPSEWDESFDDLQSTLFSSAENDPLKSASSTATLAGPGSPRKPPLPDKSEPVYVVPPPLLRPNISHRSRSSPSSKRSNDPGTPSRPLKRLREAFSPKSRHLHRSPSKVPLPQSPRTSTEKQLPRETPLPSELDDIICAFRSTQAYFSRSVDALELVREDFDSERRESEQRQKALQELMDERRRTQIEIGDSERMMLELREENRKLRGDGAKAVGESQGIIAHLEGSLAKERAQASALRAQITELTQRCQYIEQSTDRRVFELQQDLDGARQEVARVKGEVAGLRGKLDEAEFAHRSLKEGGARLARELGEKEKRLEQLERERRGAGKRWGMI